jgi:uncharacterized protein YaiI (UPF0178 family)
MIHHLPPCISSLHPDALQRPVWRLTDGEWWYDMRIWVDADACPTVIKAILFRAADRARVPVTLVANRDVSHPPSPYIDMLRVKPGFDMADNEILKRLGKNDLVVTGDIPLASEVIMAGGHALNPRGEMYTTENIRARLNLRDFMESLRASGIQTAGPSTLSQEDRRKFAGQLDAFLFRHASDP